MAADLPDPIHCPVKKAAALADWCRSSLIIPSGHRLAGQPFILPSFAQRFFEGAFAHRESALVIARKNGKSSFCGALMLACITHGSPLLQAGFAGSIVSLSALKSRKVLELMEALIKSSNLKGLEVRRSPYPYVQNTVHNCVVETLSSEKNVGHSSGYDLCLMDEVGLYDDRYRETIRGLYSSVSSRSGKVIAISISGTSDLLSEIESRADAPQTYVQIHRADENLALDDERAWHQANPGLKAGIKQLDYMTDAAALALRTPADQPFFRAHELNQRVSATADSIVSVDQWKACEPDFVPARSGRAYVGIDLGGSEAMSCLVAFWPDSGRLESYGAFSEMPDLAARGHRDGVFDLYERIYREGDLQLCGERIVDVETFLGGILPNLAPIAGIAFDRYRQSEMRQVLQRVGYAGPQIARGIGASSRADGSADIRAFRRYVLDRKIKSKRSLLFRSALRYAVLRTDAAGNPALAKTSSKKRIDVVQACVLACGIASLDSKSEQAQKIRFFA